MQANKGLIQKSVAENKKKKQSFWTTLPGILVGCMAIITAIRVLADLGIFSGKGSERRLGRRFRYFLANLTLFTPYIETTQKLWQKSVTVDYSIKRLPSPIPEIDGSSFSFDSLKRATEDFRQPAVVRGLFKGSTALEKWATPDYLPSTPLGDFVLPVITDAAYGSSQKEREDITFREAFLDVVENHAMKYLFFPVESRLELDVTQQEKETKERLRKTVNELVRNDLELDRIWPGFAGPDHKYFVGAQLIIGYGNRTPEKTTGTGWHCAVSNNFFIQVAGRKRWYFASPKMSHYFFPLRNGVNTMMTGTRDMGKIQQHIPTSYVDLEPGDMLYNPYWQWHTVMNYEGLSIGVPIREFRALLARRNNPLYTRIVLVNHIALRLFKRDIGGYA